MRFTPDLASLRQHKAPAWFEGAKLGVFLHWSLSAVPAFAPRSGDVVQLLRTRYADALTVTPYAEWYENSLKFPGSPVHRHHARVFGTRPYASFRDDFVAQLDRWSPEPLAALCAEAGARYVVPIAKHHDGFLLWPSALANPHRPDWSSPRDLIGELAGAVRARGLRFGVYYSGGLDWTFNPRPIANIGEMLASIPTDPAFADYVDGHWRELIERYRPDVLWADIGEPPGDDRLYRRLADYYNGNPDGAINDRFNPAGALHRSLHDPTALARFNAAAAAALNQPNSAFAPAAPPHCDFVTPEYASFAAASADKWEATRGIGHSFGYNANEAESDRISSDALIRLFADIVAKNGNLLLNIGPRLDGVTPPEQASRLSALGAWLRCNGAAIYDTRPWLRAEGTTGDGAPVRFTARNRSVYAIVLEPLRPGPLTIAGAPAEPATLLGLGRLDAAPTEDGVRVVIPEAAAAALGAQPAFAVRFGDGA